MAGLWDYFGGGPNPAPAPGLFDQGAPVARQNPQTGGFDQYTPPPVPSALDLLYELSGGKDMGQAYQAYQRGEYLPALGQGAWGAGQMAGMALPALRGVGALARGVAPLAREAAGAIPAMMQDTTGAIRAFHGSPHDFLPEPGYPLGRFDPNKVGTGEGAQAYGHGMPYLAEAEDVARGYRDTLAGKAPLKEYGGQPLESNRDWYNLIDRVEPQDWRLARIIDAAGKQGGIRAALDTFEPHTRNASDGPLWAAAIDKFKEGVGPAAKGRMYEVDIHADPEQFLNWDKPLSAQPDVQRILAGAGIINLRSEFPEVLARANTRTGSQIYEGLAQKLGGTREQVTPAGSYDIPYSNEALASARLKELGIPGVRYLDQGSRGTGEGTHNYAMFDPSIVEILRKYGILPPLAGAGALGFSQQQ